MRKKNTTKKDDKQEIIGQREAMVNDPNGTYMCIPVCGDTLEHFGVKEGDYLIVRETTCNDEDRISVWETPDGLTAKFAYENFGDISLYNKKDWLRSYPEKDVKLIGIAEAVQKRLEMAQ